MSGARLCGQRWLARGGPVRRLQHGSFAAFSFLAGSVLTQIVVGNPFDHLPSLPVRPGVVMILAVLLGSTAFDSYSSSPTWRNFSDRLTGSAHGAPETWCCRLGP
ncbi:hypothetical protein LAUMK191_02467 [Mycobacterium attenuatum]|nr:hypothetical protein LAUMK191_02467 [Mycobacterium attenuatum]